MLKKKYRDEKTIKSVLENYIANGLTLEKIIQLESCSQNCIRNWIKRLGIRYFKGFFQKAGKQPGCPKGTKRSEQWKQERRKLMLENNPFKDKKHSDITKEKMRAHHADFTGKNNPFRIYLERAPENRELHRTSCREGWKNLSAEKKRAIGEARSKNLAENQKFRDPKFHKHHRSGFVDNHGELMFYRSSWEEKIALNLLDTSFVEQFVLEPFCIPYWDRGIRRYMRIDFRVDLKNGKTILFEVKPSVFIKDIAKKITGIVDFCLENMFEFYIIDESLVRNKALFDALVENIFNGKFAGSWFKVLSGEFDYAV